MAITITSYTPTTGPVTGGTKAVITGTGLDTVDDVLFGDVQGAIDTTAENSATSLTVIVPAALDLTAGSVKLVLVDVDSPAQAEAATSYVYTAVSNPVLSTNTAAKWKMEIDASEAQDGSAWTPVRGITNFQPAIDQTTQDDSDYDSGIWGSKVVTQLMWSLVCDLARKTAAGYTEDPGQAILRTAYDKTGAAGVVHVRWYDRNGGPEAFEGFGTVSWSEKGGATSDLSSVTATVSGRGERTVIENPAA